MTPLRRDQRFTDVDEYPASVVFASQGVPMPGHDEHAEAAHTNPRPVKGTEQALDHADGLHDLR